MFEIKKGDRLPSLEAIIRKRADGTAIDLTTAVSVAFRMWAQRQSGGTYKVDTAAVVVAAASGSVRYDWTALDTDTVGDFFAEFVITWPSSKVQTIPTAGAMHVRVVDGGLPG